MLRLLLEAQTVQYLSLKVDGVVDCVVLLVVVGMSEAPSRFGEAVGAATISSGGGGGGGGSCGVVVRGAKRARRGSVAMIGCFQGKKEEDMIFLYVVQSTELGY
jgi:hypothetical protein